MKARTRQGVWKPPEGAAKGASNILASFQIPIESLKKIIELGVFAQACNSSSGG